VEAWDTWFRWREERDLRDLTVDDSWWRIANALASAEVVDTPRWAQRFFDAFADWRLLPGEPLLRSLGVPTRQHRLRPAHQACLNVAAFVNMPNTPAAHVGALRFEETAALAVRMLDNATGHLRGALPRSLHISLIGMGDALAQLGIPYGSPRAASVTSEVTAALATGCLEGAVRLAAERGPIPCDPGRLAQRWAERGYPAALIAEGMRWGVRYLRLTAIESRPRLALLANNVADALDPCRANRDVTVSHPPAAADTGPIAQLKLRAAARHWIDAAIDYPLLTTSPPSAQLINSCCEFAQRHRLPAPRWRDVSPERPDSEQWLSDAGRR
jgi:ribonucleoside-diphosphate reductase alpha chain